MSLLALVVSWKKWLHRLKSHRQWAPLLISATLCGLLMSVSLYGNLPWQVIGVGFLAAAILLYAEHLLSRQGRTPSHLAPLEAPFLLAHDRDLFELYRQLARSLLQISRFPDRIYRTATLEQLTSISGQVAQLAEGTLVYQGTETWRMVYERLLRSPGIQRYRSVSWVSRADYWQDEPGRRSLRLNYALQESGKVEIERIAIIADHLWPPSDPVPAESIRQWIHEQHSHGIKLQLVRQSALDREPELMVDMGIYGNRAVGIQELTADCRTVRFLLSFDFEQLLAAERRWDRLCVYGMEYPNGLDQFTLDA